MKKEDSGAIKGIAILYMVFHHCYRAYSKFNKHHVYFGSSPVMGVINVATYMKICVSLFAFVSGFGLMFTYMKRKKKGLLSTGCWTMQRLIALLSGFWVTAGLSYFVQSFLRNYNSWGNDAAERAKNIFWDCFGISRLLDSKSLNGAWWYMGAAIVFVLAMPLLAWLTEKIGGLSVLLLIILLPRYFGWGYQGGTSAYSFLTCVYMGALFQYYDLFAKIQTWLDGGAHPKVRKSVTGVILFLLILATAYSYPRVDITLYWEYCYTVTTIPVILFGVFYLFRVKPISAFLQFMGKYSLNIWLVHTFLRDELEWVWDVPVFWMVAVKIEIVALGISILLELLKKYTGYNAMIRAFQQCFDITKIDQRRKERRERRERKIAIPYESAHFLR